MGSFGHADADTLGEAVQVLAVIIEKTLNAVFGRFAPAVLFADTGGELADLIGNLAIAGLVHQARKSFAEASALAVNPWTSEENEQPQGDEKEQINSSDGAVAAADKLLQANDGGVDEIGEEDGKQKQDQGTARSVQESEPQREKQGREQNTRRA